MENKDELDQYIKQKVKEVLQEELQEPKQNSSHHRQPQKQKKQVNQRDDEKVSRRKFLKMAGLGAGGLAFSSLTTANWTPLTSGSSGGTQTLSQVLTEGNDVDGNSIIDGNTTIYDASNQYVPLSAVEDIGVNDLGFDTATQEELDGHAGDVDVHHSKTTSASELTDVSADTVTDAHHTKYTDSDAISAVNNDSDHGSTAPHNYFSGSHNDLSNVGTDDHHNQNHGNEDHTTNYSAQGHQHSGDTLKPATINGTITSRSGGLTQIDTNTYKGSSQPSNPVQGDQWIDTNNNEYKAYTGNSWTVIGDIKPAISDSVVYDFESGNVERWDIVNDLSVESDRVYAGTHSGYCDSPQTSGVGDGGPGEYQARVVPMGYSGGAQPSEFEFYWQEASGSFGGGIRLFNSNGNPEVGLATNNPQWAVADANGIEEVFGGDGYDRWIRYRITFDWSNGTFSTDFEDLQSGSTYSDSGRLLMSGVNIEEIRIEYYSSGNFVTGATSSTSKSINMWFDDIRLDV